MTVIAYSACPPRSFSGIQTVQNAIWRCIPRSPSQLGRGFPTLRSPTQHGLVLLSCGWTVTECQSRCRLHDWLVCVLIQQHSATAQQRKLLNNNWSEYSNTLSLKKQHWRSTLYQCTSTNFNNFWQVIAIELQLS